MSSKDPHSVNSFIRGGQYLFHLYDMTKQNILRGIGLCLFIGIVSGTYFYSQRFDDYDKYVIAIESTALMKSSLPITQSDYQTREIQVISPTGLRANVLMKDRYTVDWYAHEANATLSKFRGLIIVTLTSTAFLLFILTYFSQRLGRRITTDKRTRGARKVTKLELSREVNEYNEREAKKMGLEHITPYNIDGVNYPLRGETNHTLLAGTTGAGKTQLIIRIVKQIVERNDRAVIYDKMRSFIALFFNPKTDVLLNPLDKRCPPWDAFHDARNLVEWMSIADSIVQADQEDSYWSDAARSVFAHTANRLAEVSKQRGTHPTLSMLIHLLTRTSIAELHVFLKGTEAATHIDPAVEKMSGSVRSTLSRSVAPLGYIKDSTPENPGFSIRRWMADDTLKGKVFLTSREDLHPTLQPLLTMWMSLFNTSIMSQERSNERLCWFLLDELPSLGKLPSLEPALAQARQYGAAYLLGIQVVSQLEETYGIKGAQTIMGLTRTKVVFNPEDPATAKVMSDAIGKTELLRRNEGISLGAKRIRDGVNMNAQITQEHIVLPEELTALPNLEAILKLAGNLPCATINLEYIAIEGDSPGFDEDLNAIQRFTDALNTNNAAAGAAAIMDQFGPAYSGPITSQMNVITPTPTPVRPQFTPAFTEDTSQLSTPQYEQGDTDIDEFYYDESEDDLLTEDPIPLDPVSAVSTLNARKPETSNPDPAQKRNASKSYKLGSVPTSLNSLTSLDEGDDGGPERIVDKDSEEDAATHIQATRKENRRASDQLDEIADTEASKAAALAELIRADQHRRQSDETGEEKDIPTAASGRDVPDAAFGGRVDHSR